MTRLLTTSLLALGSVALASQDAFKTKCAHFGDTIDIPNVKVNLVDFVQAGTNLSLPDNPPSCDAPYQVVSVDLCRVAMVVATSDSSQITLEAWFPRAYQGRFLSTGNGGLSGCMYLFKTRAERLADGTQAFSTMTLRTLPSSALLRSVPTTVTMGPRANH